MTHFQYEGHYQEQMNAQAQSEMDALAHQMEGEAQSEVDALAHEKESMARELGVKQEPQSELPQCPSPTSFGMKLVGITFNPSGDSKVQRAKELCAELADLVKDDYMSKQSSTMHSRLFEHAIGEILNAQMNVVKVLTFNY
jgi:hypothetical protein